MSPGDPVRPAPSTSIPYQKRSMSTHPANINPGIGAPVASSSSSSSYNPPRSAQTRSMTKLAQNRKHLESYVQAERNGGKTVFGGVIKGKKRGVLLDSLKNVQEQQQQQQEGRETGGDVIDAHSRGGQEKDNARSSGLTMNTHIRSMELVPPTTSTSSSSQPSPFDSRPSTSQKEPRLEIKPGGFRMDDGESEDELLLTPRRKEKRRTQHVMTAMPAATTSGLGPDRSVFGASSSPKKPNRPFSPVTSSSILPIANATHTTEGKGPSEPLVQIKRKRPSHPSDSPTFILAHESPRPPRAHRISNPPALSPSPARPRGRTRGQTEEPSIVTPERRHKGKRRRVSDSPSKALGQRSTQTDGMMVEQDTRNRFANIIIRPPTPPRKRMGDVTVPPGTEAKKRGLGTLPSALGTVRSGGDGMQVDDTYLPSKVGSTGQTGQKLKPVGALTSQSRPNGSSTSTSSFLTRKPSYPSSLGSGFGAPPRQVVRNAVPPVDHPMDSSLSTSMGDSGLSRIAASRREGLGSETKGSLYGLSAALAKLQVKPSSTTPNTIVEGEKRRLGGFAMPTASSAAKSIGGSVDLARPAGPGTTTLKRSSTMTGQRRVSSPTSHARDQAGHGPTQTFTRATSAAPESQLVRSGTVGGNLQNLLESEAGTGCLKGVVAFVDVRTSEGDDAGTVFAEMLKFCGAKVLAKPTESCTHIVYKSGKTSTVAWYRRQEDPKPYLIGISWVTRCKEAGKRIEEGPYEINLDELETFKKRRRSMEPKQLRALIAAGNGLEPEQAPMAQLRRLSGQ